RLHDLVRGTRSFEILVMLRAAARDYFVEVCLLLRRDVVAPLHKALDRSRREDPSGVSGGEDDRLAVGRESYVAGAAEGLGRDVGVHSLGQVDRLAAVGWGDEQVRPAAVLP